MPITSNKQIATAIIKEKYQTMIVIKWVSIGDFVCAAVFMDTYYACKDTHNFKIDLLHYYNLKYKLLSNNI